MKGNMIFITLISNEFVVLKVSNIIKREKLEKFLALIQSQNMLF